jgi:phage tail P2-like protein
MTNIYESQLLQILPPNLQSDPDMIAASKVVDKEYQLLVNSIHNVYTFVNIDKASEAVVDILAIELNTDFYDAELPLAVKKKLVKNALIYKYTKGTPYALELLIKELFGDGEVEEWFEYGGQPFYFKVLTTNISVTNEELGTFTKAVNSIKNVRSHLETVEVTATDQLNLYYGSLVHIADYMTIRQVR